MTIAARLLSPPCLQLSGDIPVGVQTTGRGCCLVKNVLDAAYLPNTVMPAVIPAVVEKVNTFPDGQYPLVAALAGGVV